MPVRLAERTVFVLAGGALVGAWLMVPALAREARPAPETPMVFRQLVQCRELADPTARLACYDARVSDLDKAAQSRDLVVADRNEVRQARKGLFGFTLPKIGNLFGGGDDDAEEVRRIDTTVSSVGMTRNGSLRLVFADGGTWEQIDVRNFVIRPKAGQKAAVTKGSMGSYYVSVDGQPGIKMRRVE